MILVLCSSAFLLLRFNISSRNLEFSYANRSFDSRFSSEEVLKKSKLTHFDKVTRTTDAWQHADLKTGPSSLMEQTRRHISQTARNEWLFFRSQVKVLQRILTNSSDFLQNSEKYQKILKYLLDHGAEYYSVIDLELKKLAELDGWNKWRKQESRELRNIIQMKIKTLQNPGNCSSTPVLVCSMTNPFGFASGVHDVLWCFIKAYTSHRRLVLDTSGWHYAPNGWETLFQPLSETCRDRFEDLPSSPWPGDNDNKARWIMRVLPQDLGPRIIRLHGNPLAWWYGQFLSYLMRPNAELQSFLSTIFKQINFSAGIVGIQVRRTDKVGNEAKAHKLEDYMEHAEAYFRGLELKSLSSVKRRVYIATDEPSVLRECHSNYPDYECLYNPGSAEMASTLQTRYSTESFWHLLADIFILSQTDFIVCTMSSGVCRVAYEMKLATDETPGDVSENIISLDVPYHYAWITPAARKAVYNHRAKSLKEMSFRRGDVLVHENDHAFVFAATRGKTSDGFLKMQNRVESSEGFVPVYKTREMFQVRNFSSS